MKRAPWPGKNRIAIGLGLPLVYHDTIWVKDANGDTVMDYDLGAAGYRPRTRARRVTIKPKAPFKCYKNGSGGREVATFDEARRTCEGWRYQEFRDAINRDPFAIRGPDPCADREYEIVDADARSWVLKHIVGGWIWEVLG